MTLLSSKKTLSTPPKRYLILENSILRYSKIVLFLSLLQGNQCFDDITEYHNTALIIDAMAVFQSIKGKWSTFGELGNTIFNSIIKSASRWNATRVDFVADRYPAISIKNPEIEEWRTLGSKKSTYTIGIKKYRSSGRSALVWVKTRNPLIAFLCEYWRSYTMSQLSVLSSPYVTCKKKCLHLSCGRSDDYLIDYLK